MFSGNFHIAVGEALSEGFDTMMEQSFPGRVYTKHLVYSLT